MKTIPALITMHSDFKGVFCRYLTKKIKLKIVIFCNKLILIFLYQLCLG